MFLNGLIKEELNIEKPHGFVIHGKESHVFILKKTLYRLNQAPRAWYSWIDGNLMRLGFTESDADPKLYYKVVDNDPMILLFYVEKSGSLTSVRGSWLQSLRWRILTKCTISWD
jgi:hypothetical protein